MTELIRLALSAAFLLIPLSADAQQALERAAASSKPTSAASAAPATKASPAASRPTLSASAVPAAAAAIAKPVTLPALCAAIKLKLYKFAVNDCKRSKLVASGAISVNGVPIFGREVAPAQKSENGAKRILLIGGIHGDELTSVEIAFKWLARVGEPEAMLHHWKVVPLLNPDGFLLDKPTRTNARGVDLNRNFPTPNWAKEAARYWQVTTAKDPRRYPGPQPLSEPESRWLNGQLNSFKPDIVISIHAPLGVLDFDGPPPPPRRIGRLYLDQIGLYPGSLGNYSGQHRGVPVVTLELPNAQEMVSPFEQDRMWRDLMDWLSRNIKARDAKPSAAPSVSQAASAIEASGTALPAPYRSPQR